MKQESDALDLTIDPHATLKTELANALTHGIGILFSIVAIPMLIVTAMQHSTMGFAWACALFGFAMLLMFTSSTLYHAMTHPAAKRVLRIFDHCSIFILIGGTYAPVVVHYVDAQTAAWFLALQWAIIAAGIVLKIFFTGRFRLLSSLLYLALGWMILLIGTPVWAAVPAATFGWLLAGGLSYTIGVVFYQFRKIPYNHAIWHLFVLFASIAHFIGVLEIAAGH